MFYVAPYIDAITGYMVNTGTLGEGGAGTPSQLFRFSITALMLIQIHDFRHWRIILFMFSGIFVLEILSLLLHHNIGWLILGLIYSYKLIFALIVYFLFNEYFESDILNFDRLQNLIVNMLANYVIIIVVCDILGLSFSSYPGWQMGSKGPFAGGNAMGVFIGAGSFVILNKYFRDGDLKTLVIYLLTVKVLVGLMTKAGLIFVMVGFFLIFLRLGRWVKIVIFSIAMMIAFIFYQPIVDFLEVSFKVIAMRAERADSFWTFALGGREHYLAEMACYDYNNIPQLFKLIFGGGYKLSFRDPNSPYYEPDGIYAIEADIFDVYFMYGIIGLLLYLYVFYKGFRCKSIKGKINPIKWGWAILLLHSAIAGHVMANGAALLIMPCMLIMLEKYNDRYSCEIQVD